MLLPESIVDQVPGYVAAYAEHFADRPLFLVIDTPDAVPTVPGYDVTEVKRFARRAGALGGELDEPTRRTRSSSRYDFTILRSPRARLTG